jgi:hypothetical protein
MFFDFPSSKLISSAIPLPMYLYEGLELSTVKSEIEIVVANACMLKDKIAVTSIKIRFIMPPIEELKSYKSYTVFLMMI